MLVKGSHLSKGPTLLVDQSVHIESSLSALIDSTTERHVEIAMLEGFDSGM
jgi:hypothetical protein